MKKLLFLIPLILIGCKTQQPIYVPVHDSTSVETTETITEYPTWTIPDSAYWQLAFECDSNYNVLLKQYESLNSGIKSKIEIKEVPDMSGYGASETSADNIKNFFKAKQLQVNISAFIDSLEIQNRTIEKLRNEKRTIEVPIEVPGPEVVRNSAFAKFCIRFFFIVLVAGLVYVIVKYKLWRFIK